MVRRWKRQLLSWLLAVVVVAIILFLYVPVVRWGLIGLVCGDSFFQGLPTSYWRFELEGPPAPFGQADRAAAELKRGSAAAVPVLLEILKDKNTHARGKAALVLRAMGAEAREAVPALQQALMEEGDPVLRLAFFVALNRIAPEAVPAGWRP